jgi:hypothetical protein
MTSNVSNSTAFNPNVTKVIYRSLRMVGAYNADGTPTAEQVEDAMDVLNCMLKAWQIDGFLWLKSIFQMSLVANQYYYAIGPAGTAKFWPALTTLVQRPTRVWNLRRKTSSGYEIPLGMTGDPISRSEYMQLPNKTTPGTVVQAYYDPQLVNGMLYVWPCPSAGVTDSIMGDCDRSIQDMLEEDNTFDVPQEWIDPITFCLAERLWFEYPGNSAEYQLLAQRAIMAKENILSYNRENTSTTLGVQ